MIKSIRRRIHSLLSIVHNLLFDYFNRYRICYIKKNIYSFGNNNRISKGFRIIGKLKHVSIGNNVQLINAFIRSTNKVIIEDHVFFGYDVMLLTPKHNIYKLGLERIKDVTSKPIVIKRGCWIGTRSIIFGGVTIGVNSVVGAGSIVTKNVASYTLVAGNPAKFIKRIPH